MCKGPVVKGNRTHSKKSKKARKQGKNWWQEMRSERKLRKKNRKRACRSVGHGLKRKKRKGFIVLGFTFSSRIFTEIKFTHNAVHPF